MEKNIWIISSNKKELVETQGAVNGGGTFRTIAMLSHQSVEKAIERRHRHQTIGYNIRL